MKYPKAEPYKIKIVEPIRQLSRDERLQALERADYNVYRLHEHEVYLDFADARGNGAMSQGQWAGLMVGDEAYAGSVNFEHLAEQVEARFGKRHMVPTHRGRGAEHLLLLFLSDEGQIIVGNTPTPTLLNLVDRYHRQFVDLTVPEAQDPSSAFPFKGNLDLNRLEDLLKEKGDQVAYIVMNTASPTNGGQPFSLENLQAVAELARKYGKILTLDASTLFSMALIVQEAEPGHEQKTIFDLVRQFSELADIVYLSAREDLMSHTGGLIMTNQLEYYVEARSLVVVFEGLHTYGGLAGRDMEAIAVALREMDPNELRFRRGRLLQLAQKIRDVGYHLYEPVGTSGIMLDVSFLQRGEFPAHAFAAALYLASGVRGGPRGPYVGIFLPRRVYTSLHLDYLVEALDKAREVQEIPALELVEDYPPMRNEMARFKPVRDFPLEAHPFLVQPEPYKIKAIEPLFLTTREQRQKAIQEAGWNTFLLRSRDVYIDFLTDSGTSAMSSAQWAEVMRASEYLTYSEAYQRFVETIREVYGFPYVLPTHQGRAAEHILSQTLIQPGQYVANNMYFTTTREHQERAGGIFVDVIIDEAHEPAVRHPFKGNIDPQKLIDLIKEVGPDQVAYVCLELNVNMAGGQPVSLDNAREISEICHDFNIPLIYDGTRAAENAYFIKVREPGMEERTIEDIFKELMSYADGITVSAKKDLLVNIGGFLAVRDYELYQRMEQFAVRFEGHPADGGLAKRDLVAMAQGAREMLDFEHLRSRIGQVEYLAQKLLDAGVPIVEPPGGHAVFLDAKRFLPHLPQDHFPAQRLAGEIYLASGVRTMERGIVSAGRDPKTGKHKYPKLELVRVTIPRRVYTHLHLDVAAEGILEVFERREQIQGLRMVFEPPTLRFFTARFEPLEG